MLKIVLTGGVGSGKSTVAKYFAELGIDIIDADVIAHDLLNKPTDVYQKIVLHFGKRIFSEGELDRRSLRNIIFAEPSEKLWLENLLHPIILEIIYQRLVAVRSAYCILILPLLLETRFEGFRNIADRTLVVDAPQPVQIARVMRRDNIDFSAAKAIVAAQVDRKARLKIADDVIINDGTLEQIKLQVEKLHEKYLSRCAELKIGNGVVE